MDWTEEDYRYAEESDFWPKEFVKTHKPRIWDVFGIKFKTVPFFISLSVVGIIFGVAVGILMSL